MPASAGVIGIDPKSWTVTILPLPKRHSRGSANGFCGGHPVGRAETVRAKSAGCWWPDGKPELLVLEGRKDVEAGRAAGNLIPGSWRNDAGDMGAVLWRLEGARLVGSDLADGRFTTSWATGTGGGVIVGVGAGRAVAGQRARNVGLVWRDGEEAVAIGADGEIRLFTTDGARLAGSIQGRAALWASPDAPPVDFSPAGMAMSEIEALDGELQIGTAFKGMTARAGVWKGTGASFSDLTPKGVQTSRAHGAAGGFQVGYLRTKDNTRGGSAGADNRAVIWQGAADRWLDLNSLLPGDYNASIAWAIEFGGDEVRVCGEAVRFEVTNPGTPRESHVVPVAHPVLWTGKVRVAD